MADQATAPAQQTSPGWREQNAYTLGVQAYIYCFPWVYMPGARWLRTEDMNHEADIFTHIRKLPAWRAIDLVHRAIDDFGVEERPVSAARASIHSRFLCHP
jgi:hypothetical protein